MEAMHMSQQVFAQYIDLSPASLSSVFNGRTKPTLNIVEAIKLKFPTISTDWLMFGRGEMYENATPHSEGNLAADNGGVREPTLDFGASTTPDTTPTPKGYGSEQAVVNLSVGRKEKQQEEVKYVERPQRHVMEIRVYYDDLTFESFVPAKKS